MELHSETQHPKD